MVAVVADARLEVSAVEADEIGYEPVRGGSWSVAETVGLPFVHGQLDVASGTAPLCDEVIEDRARDVEVLAGVAQPQWGQGEGFAVSPGQMVEVDVLHAGRACGFTGARGRQDWHQAKAEPTE